MGNDQTSSAEWPVTFEEVSKEQLRDMAAMTPTQRMALAEELFQFAQAVKTARERDGKHSLRAGEQR